MSDEHETALSPFIIPRSSFLLGANGPPKISARFACNPGLISSTASWMCFWSWAFP